MNVSVYIRYASLLLVGLMAGSSFAFVLGMGPAIEQLSATSYIELHQTMDLSFPEWTAVLYAAVTVLMVSSLYLLRKEWKSLEFLLILFALICVTDELLMSWVGNLPINQIIHSWQTVSPPPDWIEVRSQWLRFMYIRSALLVSGFGLLLASSFFMKNKTRPSRQDVFVAV